MFVDFCKDTIRVTITNVTKPDDVKTFIHHPNTSTGKTNFTRSILSTMGKSFLWCYVRSKSNPNTRSIAIPLTGEYGHMSGDGTCEGPFRYIADIVKAIDPAKSEFVIETLLGQDRYILTTEFIPSNESTTTTAEDTSLDTMTPLSDGSQPLIKTNFFGD
jgi:hypothetical protein